MKQLILFILVLAFVSCKNGKKSENEVVQPTPDTEIAAKGKSHPGKKIMETECYICHNPQASQKSMIAPPMIAIKRHYIGENTTKEQFTEDLIRWVNDPEQETKMPGAISRFGSMPYIPYPDDAIAQIAEYIYDYTIEKPVWFDAHFQEEHGNGKGNKKGKGKGKEKHNASKESQTKNTERGLDYALATKAALGKNLIKAINEKGTVGAIEFCNLKAIAITDSLSVMKNAVIKRVSDKPRNQGNIANEEELGYITYFKKLINSGTKAKPIVKTENGEVDFYYPIVTNTMCLQCHGQIDKQITSNTLSTLRSLYPKDQAVGYGIKEVRGIWVVNFDEEK